MSREENTGECSPDPEDKGKKRRHQDEETNPINIPSSSSRGPLFPPWVAGNSPVKCIAPQELLNMSIDMDNMNLIHEIAVDPNFRIEDAAVNPIEQVIRDNMLKAYWDLLRDDLAKDPPSYEQAFLRLMEIKQEIMENLLSERHIRFKEQVNQTLDEGRNKRFPLRDLEKLKKRMDDNEFDAKAVSHFILEILSRLCCPERDQIIKKLTDENDLVELISGIFRLIDIMKNDLTNFAISQSRKEVETEAARVEYHAFKNYLETTTGSGGPTIDWMRQAYFELYPKNETEPASKREKEVDENAVYMAVTARGYMNLLIIGRSKDTFPETLLIDYPRFKEHACKVLQCTLVAASVLITMNVSGKELAETENFKALVKQHLIDLSNDLDKRGVNAILEDLSIQATKDAKEQAAKMNIPLTEEQEKSITSQILGLLESNPVRTVVSKRIANFMEQILKNPTGPSLPLGPGMSIIERDLCAIMAKVLRIASHNRKTFENYYKQQIAKIEAEAGPSTSSSSS